MHRKVLEVALVSRLISLAAQAVFNNLVQDYDLSEEHCEWPQSNSTHNLDSKTDKIISCLFSGNTKWDAVYFLDIAQNSYQYEQNMAFFPLTSLLFYSFGLCFVPLQYTLGLNDRSVLMLAASVVNTLAFILAALGLFNLSQTIFRNKKFAYKTALFFCFNPASVFFSVAYSESVFAMTQFWAMYFLAADNIFVATLLFSVGTSARSNGLVSVGFVIYKMLKLMFKLYTTQQHCRIHKLIFNTILTSLLVTTIILPFLSYQYLGFTLFCGSGQEPPWCNQFLPFPYNYIQKRYWNVGFLQYFEVKQLPNFLLASPVVIMCIVGVFEYLSNQTLYDVATLGLLMPQDDNGDQFVYFGHFTFLVVFGVTSMHVQVITRFILSSSPMLYWIAVKWTTPQLKPVDKTGKYGNIKSNFVFTYFLIYYWLGFLLHCNFYPWT